jgi:hypothetical protein
MIFFLLFHHLSVSAISLFMGLLDKTQSAGLLCTHDQSRFVEVSERHRSGRRVPSSPRCLNCRFMLRSFFIMAVARRSGYALLYGKQLRHSCYSPSEILNAFQVG